MVEIEASVELIKIILIKNQYLADQLSIDGHFVDVVLGTNYRPSYGQQ